MIILVLQVGGVHLQAFACVHERVRAWAQAFGLALPLKPVQQLQNVTTPQSSGVARWVQNCKSFTAPDQAMQAPPLTAGAGRGDENHVDKPTVWFSLP